MNQQQPPQYQQQPAGWGEPGGAAAADDAKQPILADDSRRALAGIQLLRRSIGSVALSVLQLLFVMHSIGSYILIKEMFLFFTVFASMMFGMRCAHLAHMKEASKSVAVTSPYSSTTAEIHMLGFTSSVGLFCTVYGCYYLGTEAETASVASFGLAVSFLTMRLRDMTDAETIATCGQSDLTKFRLVQAVLRRHVGQLVVPGLSAACAVFQYFRAISAAASDQRSMMIASCVSTVAILVLFSFVYADWFYQSTIAPYFPDSKLVARPLKYVVIGGVLLVCAMVFMSNSNADKHVFDVHMIAIGVLITVSATRDGLDADSLENESKRR